MKSAGVSAPRPHDDGVALIVVGGVSWPAHIAVEPEILLRARRRCTTGLGLSRCALRLIPDLFLPFQILIDFIPIGQVWR